MHNGGSDDAYSRNHNDLTAFGNTARELGVQRYPDDPSAPPRVVTLHPRRREPAAAPKVVPLPPTRPFDRPPKAHKPPARVASPAIRLDTVEHTIEDLSARHELDTIVLQLVHANTHPENIRLLQAYKLLRDFKARRSQIC
jgi:hypothetical protein